MRIVVYWEHSHERAIAVGLIAPLQAWLRRVAQMQRIEKYSVAAHSMVDGLAEEADKFTKDVENAFGIPAPQRIRHGRVTR